MAANEKSPEPIPIPIDGVLDLHTFPPREIGDLVPAYLTECQERGIREVRIIHGKGIGNLRRSVHAILGRHPGVISFSLAHPFFGGEGATMISLKAKSINATESTRETDGQDARDV